MNEKQFAFIIDADYFNSLKEKIGATKDSDVIFNALSILEWAITERSQDRLVVSTEKDGSGVTRLMMKPLEVAAVKARFPLV